jgi:LCP family protein required for cell wall assembly
MSQRPPRRTVRRRRIDPIDAALLVEAGMLLLLIAALGVILVRGRRALIGPALVALTGATPTQAELPSLAGAVPTLPPTQAPDAPPTLTPTPAPASGFPLNCAGSGTLTLLALGLDTRPNDAGTGRADLIRVVRVDFDSRRVSSLMIPRDLWVSIPGLDEYGEKLEEVYGEVEAEGWDDNGLPGPFGRINTAYFFGEVEDGPGGGMVILKRTLQQNFGLSVDHYLIADMQTVVKMVDLIGGVDVVEPEGVGDFPAGTNHLSGERLLLYIRVREGASDWERSERHNRLAFALSEKLRQPQTLLHLPGLLETFRGEVVTDLNGEQLAALACLATEIELEDVVFENIEGRMVQDARTTTGAAVLLPRYDAVDELIEAFMNGEPGV